MPDKIKVTAYTDPSGVPCVRISGLEHFSASDIFECGQCFRFSRTAGGRWGGVAHGRYIEVEEQGGDVVIVNTSLEDYYNIWRGYFSIEEDYAGIIGELSGDAVLRSAIASCPGLRILRQEPFEALISFIISQNNNIPRITKIIASLCENFGVKITFYGSAHYTFPTPQRLAAHGVADLAPIRAGFRAKYILDAAVKVANNIIDLGAVYNMGVVDGIKYLSGICGVGPKVASCVLLFAYGKLDAFPVDVWVGRIMEKYYPQRPPGDHGFGRYAGVAGEYLYYYERMTAGKSG